MVLTLAADGVMAQGGYSSVIRAHDRYVFAIPEAIESEHAAPMLCAGLTVFSPLVRNGTGPGKTIGIVGIGGLGRQSTAYYSDSGDLGADLGLVL